MEPERWQKIEGLYHAALAEQKDRRRALSGTGLRWR